LLDVVDGEGDGDDEDGGKKPQTVEEMMEDFM
jgi:hypothetical protein